MEVDGQVGESVSEVKVWKAVGRTVAVETGRSDDLTVASFVLWGFLGISAGKESICSAGDPGSIPVGKICYRRDRLPTPIFLGFSCGSAGKEPS